MSPDYQALQIAEYFAQLRRIGTLAGESDSNDVDSYARLSEFRAVSDALLAHIRDQHPEMHPEERFRLEQQLRSEGLVVEQEAYRNAVGKAAVARGESVETISEYYRQEKMARRISDPSRVDPHTDLT